MRSESPACHCCQTSLIRLKATPPEGALRINRQTPEAAMNQPYDVDPTGRRGAGATRGAGGKQGPAPYPLITAKLTIPPLPPANCALPRLMELLTAAGRAAVTAV